MDDKKGPVCIDPETFKKYPVLIVDDEEASIFVLKMTVEEAGFTVLTASSGEQALKIIERNSIAVLVTDQRMRGMSGTDLCELVRNRFPEVQRVLITAYSDVNTVVEAINRGGVSRYVRKPWDHCELNMVIRESIARVHLEQMVRDLQQDIHQHELHLARNTARESALHDLASFHGVITLSASVLDELIQGKNSGVQEEDQKEILKVVSNIKRAINHINLFCYHTSELLTTEPQRSRQTVTKILQSVIGLFRTYQAKNVRIRMEPPDHIEVFVDSIDITRVLANLISNAIQAIEESGQQDGEVVLSVVKQDQTVKILVRDNGPGIPDEQRQRVFDRGFTTRGERGGSGIGLNICQTLTQKNGGEIGMLAAIEKGSTFVVSFPEVSANC